MLVALVQKADGAGARALRSLGIGDEQVRSKLAHIERKETVLEATGPTRQLKTVVETAFHGVAYPEQVGTWQLVLALTSCEGNASDALAQLGAKENVLRAMAEDFGTKDG